MSTYLFLLGNTPALSRAELVAVFGETNLYEFGPSFMASDLIFTSDTAVQPENVLPRLGGTVKILEVVAKLPKNDTEGYTTAIIEFLVNQSLDGNKITFMIAEHYRDHLPAIEAALIKTSLTKQGIKARYIEQSRRGMAGAVTSHHKVTELHLIELNSESYLAITRATQSGDDWSHRDRSRPYADAHKGMLPLKVARIMVNLSLGADTLTPETNSRHTVYDPFCGAGSVLTEALVQGCNAVGSDVDAAAISGTRSNLQKLTQSWSAAPEWHVTVGDVTHIGAEQLKLRPTTIVTEPFLGKPTAPPHKLPDIFRGLQKLYLGAFKQWSRILSPGSTIVMVFPIFSEARAGLNWDQFIDNLAQLGYTAKSEPILYHRPNARVHRQIYQLQYKV